MKVLLASIPMTGHFNPILVAARMLKESGHETAIYTGIIFRDKIEKTGIRFIPLPEDADQGVRDLIASFLSKHKAKAIANTFFETLDLGGASLLLSGRCDLLHLFESHCCSHCQPPCRCD
jgi:UDP:flavonoid glycosyltransferase YjiC (YdhE family)